MQAHYELSLGLPSSFQAVCKHTNDLDGYSREESKERQPRCMHHPAAGQLQAAYTRVMTACTRFTRIVTDEPACVNASCMRHVPAMLCVDLVLRPSSGAICVLTIKTRLSMCDSAVGDWHGIAEQR